MSEPSQIVVIAAGMGGISALGGLLRQFLQTLTLPSSWRSGSKASHPVPFLKSYRAIRPFRWSYARDGAQVQQRVVLLAPMSHHLLVKAPGVLVVEPGGIGRSPRSVADYLFASAAAVYGARVVGVVLSGRLHDGTQGLQDIEAAGGVGIVQAPETASCPEMPLAGIKNDQPNYCLPVPQIAALLAQWAKTKSVAVPLV